MFWYNLNTCPVCGKKLQPTNGLISPHIYLCSDCYWTNADYHEAVDNEPDLKYHKELL